jgi:hypothetical protein
LVGIKITRKQVSRMTGLSLKTVQTHFNAELIDMDQVIYNLNHPTTSGQKYITRTTGIRFKTAFSQNNTKVTNADFHPQNVPDKFVKD